MSGEIRAALRRNFVVNVMDGAFFGFGMGAASFVTIIPLFVSQLTDSALLIALIPAIHTLGWQLPQVLTSQHVARLRRYLPFVLLVSLNERVPYLALALIALFLPRLSTELALALIYIALVWQGFGGGFAATAWQTMIGKIMPSHRLGVFFGTQQAAVSLFGAVAAALAGWLLVTLNDPVNYAAVFGIAFVAMIISWGFLSATREPPHETAESAHESVGVFLRRLPVLLRNDPNFVCFVACRWLTQIALMGSAFYAVYAVSRHSVSEVQIGFYTSVMLVTQMVLSPVLGWVGDRWSHRLAIAGGAVALALSGLLAWWVPSGGWFALVFLLLGAGQVAYWTSGNTLILEFAPTAEERPMYIGLGNTLMAPAAILAPLLGGWLADLAGYPAAFLASVVGAALTAALLFFVLRDPRHERAKLVHPAIAIDGHAAPGL